MYSDDVVDRFDFGAPTLSAGELLDDDDGIENVRLTYDDNTPLTDTAHATFQLRDLSAILPTNVWTFETHIATDTKHDRQQRHELRSRTPHDIAAVLKRTRFRLLEPARRYG